MKLIGIKKELDILDKSKARQIEKVFAPMVKMLDDFETQHDVVMAMVQSKEKCAAAKSLRIAISKIRIEAEKIKTQLEEAGAQVEVK